MISNKNTKKWLYSSILCILLTGCSLDLPFNRSSIELPQNVGSIEPLEAPPSTSQEEVELSDPLQSDLKAFFNAYYSLDENSLLVLNQHPTDVTPIYWESYEEYKTTALDGLQKYFSSSLQSNLQPGYFTTSFSFPRFVDLNNYTIIKYGPVVESTYQVLLTQGEKLIVEMNVVTEAQMLQKDAFDKRFYFDEDIRYYRKYTDTPYNSSELDRMLVQCSYIAEFEKQPDERLAFLSLTENTPIQVHEKNRRKKENNSFIKRLPYVQVDDEINHTVITFFFEEFMGLDRDGYEYFKNALHTSYTSLENFFTLDLNLTDKIELDPTAYLSQFSPEIIPLKDMIRSVEVHQPLMISTHIDSSQNTPKYMVKIPAKVMLSDYTLHTVQYTYVITFNNSHKIIKAEYMYMEYVEEESINEAQDANTTN